jgi:hypothetical protein
LVFWRSVCLLGIWLVIEMYSGLETWNVISPWHWQGCITIVHYWTEIQFCQSCSRQNGCYCAPGDFCLPLVPK